MSRRGPKCWTWKYNLQSFLRQKTEWSSFMPGGDYTEWTCLDEDATRGLVINPVYISDENFRQEAKQKTFLWRGQNEDFLTCVATFCPSGFYEFVMRESTSLQWIYDQILSTYNLQTKRQDVLNDSEMDFHFSEKFTYQPTFSWRTFICQLFYPVQYMLGKYFLCVGLSCEIISPLNYCTQRLFTANVRMILPKCSKWKGKTLSDAETLSPLAESLIIEKWLFNIHPNLPGHVKKN